jgi:hypothetical protein
MKTGDLFFVKGGGLFGALINIFNHYMYGKSNATHVGIIAKTEEEKVLVYEAVEKGFLPFWYNKERIINNKKIKIKRVSGLKGVLEICKKYEGIKYGKINIFIHSINLLLRILFKAKIDYSDKIVSMHCSEAVSRVLYDASNKKINLEKKLNKSFDLVTPQELYELE